MSDVELRLPADAQYVGMARLIVTAAARQAGMSDERLEDLRIAVSEATAQAIGSRKRHEPVVLTFGRSDDDRFEVTIADAVAPAALGQVDTAGQETWAGENGLGPTLIRGLVDDVEFHREPGARLAMRFCLSLGQEQGSDAGPSA
jgi:serine/threonine-protein kinase RsbW